MKDKIRIGCGAGFSGDRLDPSIVLVEKGTLDYLVLECLAERTIALAQKRKLQDPTKGYDPLLERRIESLIELLVSRKVCLITNMGAANPIAAAEKVVQIAKARKINLKVAAITGDDVFDRVDFGKPALETSQPISNAGNPVSANAYLGAVGIIDALKSKADVIITGRIADPSLFIAPMIHEFGWSLEDFDLLGKGTVIGHLMECAGHITGGYFADPGKKDVPDMAHLGHPFVDVSRDGSGTISKVEGTGGIINLLTAKEQLLYEVVNPFEYYTPDVIADFTSVQLMQVGPNVVKVTGGSGKARPSTYKVSVGYQASYLGEGEITYGGSNAIARAKLAGETVRERLMVDFPDLRIDLIGESSVHGKEISFTSRPYEIRLRVVGTSPSSAKAALVGEEVEALYTNGPGGGGGVRKNVTEVIGIVSTLIPREQAAHKLTLLQS
ncbi:MAG TPA: acyclic terpene utilization AtuA family protein [Chryseolinea sp.]|nr:acyclic terpene utilization AtuA family protein [Chryseolinea sp.]